MILLGTVIKIALLATTSAALLLRTLPQCCSKVTNPMYVVVRVQHRRTDYFKLCMQDSSSLWLKRLRLAELSSPSNKPSQRVACLVVCDGEEVVKATNTFFHHQGVHAELTAISAFLDYVVDNQFNSTRHYLKMILSFSPCVECAELIGMLVHAADVDCEIVYDAVYDADGLRRLRELGIRTVVMEATSDSLQLPVSKKYHSYSKQLWDKKILECSVIRAIDGSVVLTKDESTQLDIRPFAMRSLLLRRSSLDRLTLNFKGELNHREKMFLNICGMDWSSVK